MYLIHTPVFIQNLFPNFVWKVHTDRKEIFLTFDDGPIPEITPWVLDQLEKFQAKATFFCVGDNVRKFPNVFERIKSEGHSIGNHTFNHLSGWASDNIPYFHNIRQCAHLVDSTFFRPPYGRMKPRQVQFLQRHYNIVMWDVLSGDFDRQISREQCLENVTKNARNGSIVVFHDSLKALKNLEYALPKTLEYFTKKGFTFSRLESHHTKKSTRLRQTA